MKPTVEFKSHRHLVALLVFLFCATSPAQIFVANTATGVIGKYSPTGQTLNASLITGLATTEGIAVDGNGFLYVASEDGSIGKYTTTGEVINRTLISGLPTPWAIALDSDGNLYVANAGGTISKYTSSGEPINPALVSGLPTPLGIAVDRMGHVFVSNIGRFEEGWIGSIGKYTTSGEPVNEMLVSGLKWNWGIVLNESGNLSVAFNIGPGRIAQYTTSGAAVSAFDTGLAAPTALALDAEGHLLVADDWFGVVGQYTTAGQTVNAALIGGLHNPRGVAVAVPPKSLELLAGDQTVEAGRAARLRARCKGTWPLTYLWLLKGTLAATPATNPVLELTNASPSQSGAYTLVVTNAFGAVTSAPVNLSVVPLIQRTPVPALSLAGQVGSTLNLDSTAQLEGSPSWTALDRVVLTNTPQFYFDLTAPLPPQRFYRAWQTNGAAPPLALGLNFVPAVTLTGASGSSVRLDCINQFGPVDAWVTLAEVVLTNTPSLYFDTTSIGQPPRLYRIVPLPSARANAP